MTTNNLIRGSRLDIEHLVFENGPKRVGPFSHAVKAGDFIFVTGQMPTLPDNPDVLVSNDVEEQTHQVMKNLMSVLKQSGSSLDRVTFVRVYLVNFQDFDKVNKISGMDITFVTNTDSDEEALTLLTELGLPFKNKNK